MLTCLHLCGGPTGLLQGIAWVKMSVDYSAQDGVVIGLKKAFDGEHPCELCKAVAKAKRDAGESNPLDVPVARKEFKWSKDLSSMDTIAWPQVSRAGTVLALMICPALAPGRIRVAPPVPPPRLV
jgi:hypothetical protein